MIGFLGFNLSLEAKKNKVESLYKNYCLTCHGKNLEGGLGTALLNLKWLDPRMNDTFTSIVQKGNIENGMPAFDSVIEKEEIRALLVYVQEKSTYSNLDSEKPLSSDASGIYSTQHHDFKFELLHTLKEGIFWSLHFLPQGELLLTQKEGNLFLYRNGFMSKPIRGPKIRYGGQGGLLEAAAHPEYRENGWIYLSYADSLDNNRTSMTSIVRGKILNHRWVEEEMIFQAPKRFHTSQKKHYGSRIVFKENYLYFSVGDRGDASGAQDLKKPNGKIHRIHLDGSIPSDNPFIGLKNAYPTVWAYGVRNPQGLVKHPDLNEIWEVEHGPRGGDELNLIKKGTNYGWPEITYGINYNGTPITSETKREGMEQPIYYWVPSIAMCGIDFYTGKSFKKWKNHLFIGALKARQLERIQLDRGKIIEHEVIFKDKGRIRDVASGPDGNLYFVMDSLDGNSGASVLCRLVPVK